MLKYKNKYRIPTARAQWWNYGWNGAYFVTICTKNKAHYFGKVVNGKMVLSPLGVIADLLWHEIPHHSPYVALGEFVVMPNHIHGILILNKPNDPIESGPPESHDPIASPAISDSGLPIESHGSIASHTLVQTGHALSLPESHGPIPSPTLSSIIGSYKSAVTKHANRLGFENGWQSRFHDHIIRNEVAYEYISNYIIRNPAKWAEKHSKPK